MIFVNIYFRIEDFNANYFVVVIFDIKNKNIKFGLYPYS